MGFDGLARHFGLQVEVGLRPVPKGLGAFGEGLTRNRNVIWRGGPEEVRPAPVPDHQALEVRALPDLVDGLGPCENVQRVPRSNWQNRCDGLPRDAALLERALDPLRP